MSKNAKQPIFTKKLSSHSAKKSIPEKEIFQLHTKCMKIEQDSPIFHQMLHRRSERHFNVEAI